MLCDPTSHDSVTLYVIVLCDAMSHDSVTLYIIVSCDAMSHDSVTLHRSQDHPGLVSGIHGTGTPSPGVTASACEQRSVVSVV